MDTNELLKPIRLIVVGAAVAILTVLWWNAEVTARIGQVSFDDSFSCLTNLGTGNCGSLWFVGLHEENQHAGVVFWFGAIVACVGIWRKALEHSNDSSRNNRK